MNELSHRGRCLRGHSGTGTFGDGLALMLGPQGETLPPGVFTERLLPSDGIEETRIIISWRRQRRG